MDWLAKVIINDQVFFTIAQEPFMILSQRFIQTDESIQDFLFKFCTLTLSQVIPVNAPRPPKKGAPPLPLPIQNQNQDPRVFI